MCKPKDMMKLQNSPKSYYHVEKSSNIDDKQHMKVKIIYLTLFFIQIVNKIGIYKFDKAKNLLKSN